MRKPPLMLLAVLAALSLPLCVAGALWLARPRAPRAVFDEWRSIADVDQRSVVADEIVRGEHLVGLSAERVVHELGRPNRRRMSRAYGDIKYVVGPNWV